MMRNSILASALAVSSMENLDGAGETAELNPITEETTVAIDEILEEVRDQGDSVEEHDSAVEELEGAAESLESLIVSLESAIADGGMSPQAADVHGRAMVNAVRRLPIDGSQYSVSVESFGGTGDKLQASMEAMEGAKDLLAKIWNAIKSAVQSAWAAVVKFITTLGKSGEALVRAGGQLKASANGIKGEPKAKTVAAGGVAKWLHTDGELKGSVGSQLKLVVSNGSGVAKSAQAGSAGLKELAGLIASGHYNAEGDRHAFADKVAAALPTGKLPGGREIDFGDNGMPKLVAKINLKDDATEIATPNKAELVSIGNEIVAVGKMIVDFDKKYFKDLEKSVNDFISKQDALVKKAEFSKEETDKVRAGLKEFKKFSSVARACGPDYMSYAANAAKAAFNFGKKALAAYN
ncbi:hypothetical protein D9M68_19440 [compost metagenome]